LDVLTVGNYRPKSEKQGLEEGVKDLRQWWLRRIMLWNNRLSDR